MENNIRELLSDEELESVIGGAGVTFLQKTADGKVNMYTATGSGDIEILKKLLKGKNTGKISFSSGISKRTGVRADKVDAMIERLKKKNPDMVFEWI